MATQGNPILEQAEADMDRLIQLAEQAVEDNHNNLTQGGKRLGISGHDYSTHSLCAHPDCYLLRTLRYTRKTMKNMERHAEADTVAEGSSR